MKSLFPADRPWPVWQLFLFRIIFIFLILMMDPLDWLFGMLQWENSFYTAYDATRTRAVTWANDHFFHIRKELVQPAGSGDTSFVWAFLCCVICLTAIGAVVWSLADLRRGQYRRLSYWFRNYIRYYLITTAITYGLAKLTLGQMGTLGPVDLDTRVGDLSPMRLCWYFIAASPPYQIFSGIMELMAGFLLLFRRTITLGLLLGLAVFSNVMLLNFTYDICVKIFSAELVLGIFALIFRDYERMISFFLLNRPTARNELYDPVSTTRSFRIGRIVLKTAFIFGAVIVPFWPVIRYGIHPGGKPVYSPVPAGVYDIIHFSRNGDSSLLPEKRWARIVLDPGGYGSLEGDSSIFRYNYGHTVFRYKADSASPTSLVLYGRVSRDPASRMDSVYLHCQLLKPGLIQINAKSGADSLHFVAALSHHRYRLEQWQFHWISEYTP